MTTDLSNLPPSDTEDTVIDARSENEYALDHLSGALNWPTLDNAERIAIGTMYTQVNAFEAKKRGADYLDELTLSGADGTGAEMKTNIRYLREKTSTLLQF